ncbi:MAG: SDR family oxidoreductase [Deltaproteobacteria bacterium]|nr:SDR family oxidoreductase [Deltaproteobacteria bacterium]
MRIVVTGGAGFIGSHLCAKLLRHGHEVLCVDNLFTGSKRNIVPLLSNPYFEFIRHDITFPLYLEADAIYNLACPASPIHYQRDPVQTIKLGTSGMLNMLGLAKRLRIPILQASTSEVYGDPAIHPQREEYWGNVNPIGERACYDEGKRVAEALCFSYHRQIGVPIKVVRIFNTYGPCMALDDGRVISNFIVQALRGEPLTIYGAGTQTRSFCYVDDTVDALVRMMATGPQVTGPINVGNPVEVTVKRLAEMVLDALNLPHRFEERPLPHDDPTRRCPDITKARTVLGWEPTTDFAHGLRRTIGHFQEILHAQAPRGN